MLKIVRIVDRETNDVVYVARSAILMLEPRTVIFNDNGEPEAATGTLIHTGFAVIESPTDIEELQKVITL